MKKILITGADSYIGTSFEKWMIRYEGYEVDTVGTKNGEWKNKDFSGYDVVFHVAGIAHVKEKKPMKTLYYDVNYKLAVNIAKKAKRQLVKQFIYLSSMGVYGMEIGFINHSTIPNPKSYYAKSKLMAEEVLVKMETHEFNIVILRPPMVYGKGCRGNYQKLVKLARIIPIFPDLKNERSMIHIDNLCEFVKLVIVHEEKGVFVPQNKEYVSTSEMVRLIAKELGRDIRLVKVFNPFIRIFGDKIPLVKKVFGNIVYDRKASDYMGFRYCVRGFIESIK